MRTDAKIGFAIVGVLLAVLAVYAVVIPKKARQAANAAGPTVKVQPEPAVSNDSTVVVPPVDAEPAHGGEPTLTRVVPDVAGHPPTAPVEPVGSSTRTGTAEGLTGGADAGALGHRLDAAADAVAGAGPRREGRSQAAPPR